MARKQNQIASQFATGLTLDQMLIYAKLSQEAKQKLESEFTKEYTSNSEANNKEVVSNLPKTQYDRTIKNLNSLVPEMKEQVSKLLSEAKEMALI